MNKIIAAIFTVFFTLPVLGLPSNFVDTSLLPASLDPSLKGLSGQSTQQTVSSEASAPTIANRAASSGKSDKNILQKAGDGISKGAKAVGKGVTNAAKAVGKGATTAWNATSNFVSGIFKGAEPCSDDADKKLKDKVKCPAGKCTDSTSSLVEKTKLDTKQTGFKEGNKEENGEPKAGKCVIAKCIKGWVVNDTKDGCEQSEGDCTDKAKEMHQKATAGELKKGKCQITECEYGWHASDDAQTCEQAELSEADSKQKVADLKDNAQKMKDKEQSTANKLLGGAAIGATGIGAMNLASGLAEQKADSAAEEDMKAYLATFVCDYGQGRNIKGGETNIDLPGGNDLFADVNEYRALAADLKIRKEALGKQPGIESEVIIDAADTGLYDNVGMGRQSGAYTSLSRALTDETSKDAEEWAKQKADTASKVKTGAITAGAGAIGGMIGNLAINSGEKNKNKVNEINKKYEGMKQAMEKLEQSVKQLPVIETPKGCPEDATGTKHPECKCTDKSKVYNVNTGQCEQCDSNKEADSEGLTCICPADTPNWSTKINKCVANPYGCVKIAKTDEENLLLEIKGDPDDKEFGKNCEFECSNGYTYKKEDNYDRCICPEETHEVVNGECQLKTATPPSKQIVLPGDTLFDINSSNISDAAKEDIKKFASELPSFKNTSDYCLHITGHTDRTGTTKINQNLSAKRADAVAAVLQDADIPATNIKTKGCAAKTCTEKGSNKECRKVIIILKEASCDTAGEIQCKEE